ncbi:hypothetical protein [Marinobacterium aestuariivivens]|uniref:Uncharacterized protein n=1 Tax=Marinobacterium aestuariivivens TaxID=1698799 RepID=A0ABW1ZVC8_9GAMM
MNEALIIDAIRTPHSGIARYAGTLAGICADHRGTPLLETTATEASA